MTSHVLLLLFIGGQSQARCFMYPISHPTRIFKGRNCKTYITYWGSWGLEKTTELSQCTLPGGIRMGILTQVCLASKWVVFPLYFTARLGTGLLQGWVSTQQSFSKGNRCVGRREEETLRGPRRSAPGWEQADSRACHFWSMTASSSCAGTVLLNKLHLLSHTTQPGVLLPVSI